MLTTTGTGNFIKFPLLAACLILLASCRPSATENGGDKEPAPVVEVATISNRDLESFEAIPATVIYFDKSDLLAPVTGFLNKVDVQTGDFVRKDQLLFELETKEHRAINRDTALQNDKIANYGLFSVKSPAAGYVTNTLHQKGDFVTEGVGLCSIVNNDHILVEAYVPLELRQALNKNPQVILSLPDHQKVEASLERNINQVDPTSQMLRILFKPTLQNLLPEGLNLQVLIPSFKTKNAQVLPKHAVLSNEKLNEYWVMVLKNDSVAVKVPVTIGISHSDSIEVKSPKFSPENRILVEGNYGLPDTARVELKP